MWQQRVGTAPDHEISTALLDDAEAARLVRAAQQSDDRALTQIYRLYAERIFRYIYYRVGERTRAEELHGEVFVRLLENIGAFRPSAQGQALALTGWIYRIAHNLIVDEYRRRKTRGEAEPLAEESDEGLVAEAPLDFHLTRADLQTALRQLTADQQAVIVLRFDQGLTSAEIARVLGKNETAVKALQRRALAALARLLTPPAAAVA